MTEYTDITCEYPGGCHKPVEEKTYQVCLKYKLPLIQCTIHTTAFLIEQKLAKEEARKDQLNLKVRAGREPGNKSFGKPDEIALSRTAKLLGLDIETTREHFIESGILEHRVLQREAIIYTFIKKESVLRLVEQIRRKDNIIEALPPKVRFRLYGHIEQIDERIRNGALG